LSGARVAAAVAIALVASGCMTKTIRTPVFEENFVEVYLRHEQRGGDAVERGYGHPITISPVRMTNMIARIEVRKDDSKDRQPAIPTELLYPVGEGISRALAKADPSQEVVVMARERKRSLAIFTQDYLTSLVVWAEGEKVFLKLGSLDAPLSKNPNDKPKEPKRDELAGKFRAVPSDGIGVENAQLVSANWRDPLFKDPGVLHVRAGGQIVRRTVLMESEDGTATPGDGGEAIVPPQGLSPESLRALADLEEWRRRGQVTEAEYQAKRREILSGELPAAPQQPPSSP
jgi:hypothetical protein